MHYDHIMEVTRQQIRTAAQTILIAIELVKMWRGVLRVLRAQREVLKAE